MFKKDKGPIYVIQFLYFFRNTVTKPVEIIFQTFYAPKMPKLFFFNYGLILT